MHGPSRDGQLQRACSAAWFFLVAVPRFLRRATETAQSTNANSQAPKAMKSSSLTSRATHFVKTRLPAAAAHVSEPNGTRLAHASEKT